MLYFLKNTLTGVEIKLEEKDYSIGRKECDIVLENDQSISRKHAYIRIKNNCITLEDAGSRYHTFHNSVQLAPETAVTLNHKDIIQFGILRHTFSFGIYQFIVTASGLSSDQKKILKNNVEHCGGKFVDKWSPDCTYLVVEEITLTIKVLQALIEEKTIVTSDYWVAYKQSKDNNTSMPDINRYCNPKICEQLLKSGFQDLNVNADRKSLFKNKVFVFYKTSFKEQMQNVVESCGGECIAWDKEEKSFAEMSLSPKEYLIIKTDETCDSFKNIIKQYKKNKKRAIQLNEIALAIINCSCQTHCNSNFNKANEIFGKQTQKFESEVILVKDTQTQLSSIASVHIKSENIIPSSEDMNFTDSCMDTVVSNPVGIKRLNSNEDENAPKKQKLLTSCEKTKDISNVFKKVEDNIKMEKNEAPIERRTKTKANGVSTQKINPFALFKQGTSKKRTFSTIDDSEKAIGDQLKKGKATIQDDTFEPIISKKESNTTGQALSNSDIVKECQSYIHSFDKSAITGMWISKNSTIKCETSKIEDPELREIADAFKNCVSIKVIAVSFKENSSKIDDYSYAVSNTDTKNFKKFRKVAPLKPQVNFISRNTLVKVCANTVGCSALDIKSDSEDEVKEKPKQKLKQFIF